MPCALDETVTYREMHRRVAALAQRVWQENPELEQRPYQVAAAALYSSRRCNLCAGVQGVGKTLIVALLVACLYDRRWRRAGQVQILAPSLLSAYSRWRTDLERVSCLRGLVSVIEDRRQLVKVRAPIWVYHHDLLTCKAPDRRGQVADYLRRHHKPSLLVIDEIHHFKPKILRTGALVRLRQVSRRCLGLSGTLTDARLDLLHQALSLVYQELWPYRDVNQFRRAFGCKEAVGRWRESEEPEESDRYLDFVALPQLGDYFRTINRFVHRLSFDQPSVRSCCRMPEAVHHEEAIPASASQLQIHHDILRQQASWVEQLRKYGDEKTILTLFQPLLQVCWLPPEREAHPRFQRLLAIVQGSERCGVFVGHIETARWLTEALSRHWPGQVVRLYAQDPQVHPPRLKPEQRQEIVERICHDPTVKVAVLALQIGAESIDLTSLSHLCFWSVGWSALQVAQAINRAVRPGNKHEQVHLHWFWHPELLDNYQRQLLREKLRISRRLLDYDPYLSLEPSESTQTFQTILHQCYEQHQSQS